MVRHLLQGVTLLPGPQQQPRTSDVLLEDNRLVAEGDEAHRLLPLAPVVRIEAGGCWLAPPLVDPHSVLEDPWDGRAETLSSLAAAAVSGGYGTVALLPRAHDWRDRPERLQLHWPEPLRLRLWGSLSLKGADQDLAAHADQLAAGALGLAGDDHLPPLPLLESSLRLAEMAERPVLLAPRETPLTRQGFVRERVEALRAGWPLDPVVSETLPLQTLLALGDAHPSARLVLMNLSTREAVEQLRRHPQPPAATVSWWHLLADSGRLDPSDEGWRVVPSLGNPADREALIAALAEGLITAVAVQHQPLDAEERLLPVDQRRAGVAGHGLALSLLWHELVVGRGWAVPQLWQVLCWGPAALLGEQPESLVFPSQRWILFDPAAFWNWDATSCPSLAANQMHWGQPLVGRVRASGLSDPAGWCLMD
ncbi:dihydroorotase [Synechococcus sp. CS-1328]|uniref:dihydroorotase n=1 Tax=Synechococcus sp. CS-1328 TaxID=2847976 RepID=UPI00223BA26A|nr:dihydroorotase [Synechococcus sp. CS-1328]MCT0225143.1 dihydroorotase [Synechococcus sp. CS-1328]